ncbi:MAG TPA: dTDP-4-dehydrorhamnose 3,5-epimerase family protein [Candidatus Polarisedimenticolaceae bacterium]|nr:dTDP-4-dehydrorhamnose 3,5-epimerase family protein [Candidatus Polarisedimenticolaceae bacterium]
MKLTPEAEQAFRRQRYEAEPPIDGVALIELRRHHDDGSSMIELLRLPGERPAGLRGFEPVQINYSTLQPGAVKAFHLHQRQTDVWFVPPEDRVLLVLADVRAGAASTGRRMRLVLGDSRPALVRIPPGVAHGCRNLGDRPARILYLTDRLFSAEPADNDEGRLPWDFLGADVWNVRWE